jgi:hypothetical protein
MRPSISTVKHSSAGATNLEHTMQTRTKFKARMWLLTASLQEVDAGCFAARQCLTVTKAEHQGARELTCPLGSFLFVVHHNGEDEHVLLPYASFSA